MFHVFVPSTGFLFPGDTFRRDITVEGGPREFISGTEFLISSRDAAEIYVLDKSGSHLRTIDATTGATTYQFSYDPNGRLSGVTDRNGNTTRIERDGRGNPSAIVGPFGQRTALSVDSNGYLGSVTDPTGATTQFATSSTGLLEKITDAAGDVTDIFYNPQGELIGERTNAGVQTVSRNATTWGFAVDWKGSLGRTVLYADVPQSAQKQESEELHRDVAFPDGSHSTSTELLDISSVLRTRSGMTISSQVASDPLWGKQAPLETRVYTGTDGASGPSVQPSRQVEISTPNDPLSLSKRTDTTLIGDRSFTDVFDVPARTETRISPSGRR